MNVAAIGRLVQHCCRRADAIGVQPLNVFAAAELCEKVFKLIKKCRFSAASPVNQGAVLEQVFCKELTNRAQNAVTHFPIGNGIAPRSVVGPLQPAVVAFEVAASIVCNSDPVELPGSPWPASKDEVRATLASRMPAFLILFVNFIFGLSNRVEIQRAACVVHKFRLASAMMDFSASA